ncbi:MAG: HU family DNA-binding protein [Rhodobiaceae bacterium]|nr:HU family DNA-binding protein [Rhodobiaceae bacterium]MCC0041347.1 HU family DNA-binding protein [Rhodobiaceae bacterium]MCC0052678.1 HU family DNA-binding protein [Rhodobiaceae bacterium]
MNKQELISKVAETSGMKKNEAANAVEAMIEAIAASLKSGDDVKIAGFGSFQVAERAASVGRNPRTGQPVSIPAAKTPKFKAGKALKDMVNAA